MTIENRPHERYLTAHHEAGHAVAALMRGGGELTSISIDCADPCSKAGHPKTPHAGYTGIRVKPWDQQFVTYAGPWAEARCQWNRDSLDGEDDDGRSFHDHVLGAFLVNRDGDSEEYRQLEDGVTLPDGTVSESPTARKAQFLGRPRVELIAEREQAWMRELEGRWPVIHAVAELLMQGCTDVEVIAEAVTGS